MRTGVIEIAYGSNCRFVDGEPPGGILLKGEVPGKEEQNLSDDNLSQT